MGCMCCKTYDALPSSEVCWPAYEDMRYTYDVYDEEVHLLSTRGNTKKAALEALIRVAKTHGLNIAYDADVKQWHAGRYRHVSYIQQGPCCGCVDKRRVGYCRVFFFHDTHLNQHVCQLFYD